MRPKRNALEREHGWVEGANTRWEEGRIIARAKNDYLRAQKITPTPLRRKSRVRQSSTKRAALAACPFSSPPSTALSKDTRSRNINHPFPSINLATQPLTTRYPLILTCNLCPTHPPSLTRE